MNIILVLVALIGGDWQMHPVGKFDSMESCEAKRPEVVAAIIEAKISAGAACMQLVQGSAT